MGGMSHLVQAERAAERTVEKADAASEEARAALARIRDAINREAGLAIESGALLPSDLITVAEAAELFYSTPGTIKRKVKEAGIGHFVINKWMVSRAAALDMFTRRP